MKNHPKLQLLMVYLGLVMLFMTIAQPGFSQSVHDETKSQKINNALNEVTNSNKAPGMIGAIISSEGIIAISSAGVRKAGSDIPFAISDHVHLGSCGKAMTSAMLATLVAEGKLSWETRFIEVLPELKSKIHSDYHDVTIWELLTHRSGAPSWWTLSQRYTKEKRLELLLDKLKAPAPKKRGEFHYSNLGYVMAGYMAEKITGGKWETLMQGRVFNPLGMTSAGFGFPGTKGKVEQPWGHGRSGNRWYASQKDSSEAIGPAGTIHCSIDDWARFISIFMSAKNPILERKYLDKLVDPTGHYAGGWGVVEQPWAKGIVYTHNGSNSTWYSTVMIAPKLNKAFVVVTNSRDFGNTVGICSSVISKLVRIEVPREKN